MNKKFSTLLASVLLAGAVGTVQATDEVTSKNTACGANGITGTEFEEKEEIDAEQFYFVTTGTTTVAHADDATSATKYLSISEEANSAFKAVLVEKSAASASLDALNHALWRIEPQVTEDGGVTRFVLVNKATGLVLSYDPANATTSKTAESTSEATYLGGAYPNWKWFDSKFNGMSDNFSEAQELSVVFSKGDSTIVLATAKDDGATIFAHKYATKKGLNSGVTALALNIVKAGTYVLSAKDLNKETSAKNVKYMQLNFGDNADNNIFAEKYQAQEFDRSGDDKGRDFYLSLVTKQDNNGWTGGYDINNDDYKHYLVLNKIANDGSLSNKYLHIDTAYYASKGATYKLYNTISVSKDPVEIEAGKLKNNRFDQGYPLDAYRFQFIKNLANDSVWVRSLVEAYEMKKASTDVFNDSREGAYTSWNWVVDNTLTVDEKYQYESVKEMPKATDVHNGKGVNVILSHCTLEGETEKVVTFYTCDEGKAKDNYVNLLAYDGVSQSYSTIAEGIYTIRIKSHLTNSHYVGSYAFDSFCGEFAWGSEAKQELSHMPAYQWVVEKVIKNGDMASVSPVKVINRDFGTSAGLFEGKLIHQFIKMDGLAANELYYNGNVYEFTLVDPTTTEGYFHEVATDPAEFLSYKLTYLSGLAAEGINLEVGLATEGDETILTVGKTGVSFTLEPVEKLDKQGYTADIKTVTYKLKAEDGIFYGDGTKKYVMSNYVNGNVKYVLTAEENAATVFTLKEQNCVDGTHYYALLEVYPSEEKGVCALFKAGVDDITAQLRQECACGCDNETRTSSFMLTPDTTPLYRRLGKTLEADGFNDNDVNVAKIFRINSTEKEYLYEDAQSVYSTGKGINFLGIEGKGDNKLAAMTVDTAYVRNNTTMPQYMFVMGAVRHEAGMMCPENEEHNDPEYIAKFGDCGHKVPTQAYTTGRYLVNFADSVELADNKKDYIWNVKYTRLGFVEAKHIVDTLVIYRNGQPSTASADSIFLGDNKHNKDGIKNAVFALRLVNTDPADFLIETEGDKKIPSENEGAWVAIKNGVPVVADYASYEDAIRDAEIFNIETTTEDPTSNEAVEAAEVSVVATTGAVIVKGAAGKVVTVANILGQTIANQVAASDNITIAAPAGVAVVTVDGEATKVIVK